MIVNRIRIAASKLVEEVLEDTGYSDTLLKDRSFRRVYDAMNKIDLEWYLWKFVFDNNGGVRTEDAKDDGSDDEADEQDRVWMGATTRAKEVAGIVGKVYE